MILNLFEELTGKYLIGAIPKGFSSTQANVFSGSLIKNTKENGIPYFLTAHHSIVNAGNDAISDPDASDFIFWWNYERPQCNSGYAPYDQTIGATVIANDDPTDFALLKLLESPYDLSPQIQAYFNGWDRYIPVGGNVCIHHPHLYPKMISTSNHTTLTGWTYFWRVAWDQTQNGRSHVYEGSSGAPLFNIYHNSRVIGQLTGSDPSTCTVRQTSYFGKFAISWNHNQSDVRRRLKEWLDPNNSGVTYLDGSYCTSTEYIFNTELEDDAIIYGCSIELQDVTISNGANIVFHSYSDLIINGEFEIELGSTLEIQ